MAVAVRVSAMDDECNGEWDSSYKSVQLHQRSGSFPIGVRKKKRFWGPDLRTMKCFVPLGWL